MADKPEDGNEIRPRTMEEIERTQTGDLDGDLETVDADGKRIPRIPIPIPWTSRWREPWPTK